MSLKEGTLFLKTYRIIRHLGSGGMSSVYLSENLKDGKHYVIKSIIFSSSTEIDEHNAKKLFYKEAGFLKKFSHPGLPKFHMLFNEKGIDYLVMDYIEGENLAEIIKRAKEKPLETELAVKWTIELASILNYLHTSFSRPVVYKDLKPANIIISKENSAKLIDFGIARYYDPAKKTDTFRLCSPGYMAPEHFSGRGQTSPRTDIYCLGIILYEMLTNYDPSVTPFRYPPASSLNPSINKELENIVNRAIKIKPAERYTTAKEFQKKLESFLEREKYRTKKLIVKSHEKDPSNSGNNIIKSCLNKIFSEISINLFYPFIVKPEDIFSMEDSAYMGKVKKLLRKDPSLIERKDKETGFTPLQMALKENKLNIADFLLNRGANINQKDKSGNSPLQLAVRNGDKEMARFLISRGADVNIKDKYKNSLLEWALGKGEMEIAELLINSGADFHDKKYNILHWVFNKGNLEIADLLISRGVDINSKDSLGNTPLHSAVREGNQKVAEFLLTRGVDINSKDSTGKTAIDIAKEENNAEIISLLERYSTIKS